MVYKTLKKQCFDANMEIPRQHLAIYTFGNVSVFDREKQIFAIKPSGLPYEKMKIDDIVVVDLEGNIIEGNLKPSSDTPTHAVLYKSFPQLGGIVHTHSLYATAWAQACRPLPVYGTTHADHLTGDIPVTEIMNDIMIQGNYEEETGNQILQTLKDLNLSVDEVQMILVACHGPFTWGETPEKAVYNAAVLETLATMAFISEQLNPKVKRMKQTLIQKHFDRKHGKDAYYGQS